LLGGARHRNRRANRAGANHPLPSSRPNHRAHVQRLGQKSASVFVPIVIAVATAASLWWGFAPENARAVT